MESKELRIGNLLKYDDGTIVEVLTVSSRDIVVKRFPQPLNISVLHPILLTPEILEKAGFENNDGEFSHPENTDFDLIFFCSPNGLWCAYNLGNGQGFVPFVETIPGAPVLNPICNPFKYVHQLQNLYFALTGEELEINLT